MNRKINIRFLIVSFTAIILTMVLSTAVFYEVFRAEVIDGLKTYTNVLKSTGVFDDVNNISYKADGEDVRVTLISSDGIVEYDNEADAVDMDNHVDRPEVEEAFNLGEGEAVRKSTTLNKSAFYYAVLLDNGYVLRVGKETSSMWSMFGRAFPAIILIVILLFIMTFILARYLTGSIVKPIEQMAGDLDHIENIEAYKELKPFINLIHEQHNEVLKTAKIRQEFTANVSHELKTPLTAISGYSELIETGMANDDDVKRFAKEIHHSSNRLLTLINDIIRLSELDATESDIVIEDVDLYVTAQSAVDMMQLSAKKHGVTLLISGSSAHVRANRTMMEELVYNLIDNAIRYNNKGGSVQVNVDCDADNTVLNVKDTGIGISKENQERIFERFYRVDKSRSKSTGGTGLGLAIVKHIVARHDAHIQIKSEVGAGTEIEVQFKKY